MSIKIVDSVNVEAIADQITKIKSELNELETMLIELYIETG